MRDFSSYTQPNRPGVISTVFGDFGELLNPIIDFTRAERFAYIHYSLGIIDAFLSSIIVDRLHPRFIVVCKDALAQLQIDQIAGGRAAEADTSTQSTIKSEG